MSSPPVASVVVELAADIPAMAEVPGHQVMYRHLAFWPDTFSTATAEAHIKKQCLSSAIHIAAAAGIYGTHWLDDIN
jgi:hypothetical protein